MKKKLTYSIVIGFAVSAWTVFAAEEVGSAVAVVSAEEIQSAPEASTESIYDKVWDTVTFIDNDDAKVV